MAGGGIYHQGEETTMMPLRVLVISRNYPSPILPNLGVWAESLVSAMGKLCEVRVVAPVPYCPPLPSFIEYARFRKIPSKELRNGIEVFHPRFITGPGLSLHNFEATTFVWSMRANIDELRREFPFDLIHAHFIYPDGAAAARLARCYRVPVVISEHAPWLPWLENFPRVQRQAVWAANESSYLVTGSRYGQQSIAHFIGDSKKLCIIPIGVNPNLFTLLAEGCQPNLNQILFVGQINFNKGVDLLLRAMRVLVKTRPDLRLVLVGGSFYRHKRQQEEKLRALAQELALEQQVEFVGEKSPTEVARFMRESALVVLPSRAENFGAVLVEALACGTPVIATRCGGPEDIVNDNVGLLVPKEDPDALAAGIASMLNRRATFDSRKLRAYALDNFAWEHIARKYVNLFEQSLAGRAQ